MSSVTEEDTAKSFKEYLEAHNIHDLFTKIVEELLKTQPEQPLQTIVDYLAEEHGVRATGAKVADERPEEVIESYHEDDDDSGDDEDDEDVGEMVEMVKTKPASRRVSVSAGVISFTAAKPAAPVFEKSEEEKAAIISRLKENTLFKGCDSSELSTIALAMERCTFPNDETIIQQGDLVAEHFFLLESGTCEAFIENVGSVKKYGEGDTFGELALLYNQPRAATVKATSDDTQLWRLDQTTFKNIIVVGVIQKREKYVEFLKRCSLMNELEEVEMMTLADSLDKREFKQGDEIIRQDDVGLEFFIVEQGELQCVKDGQDVLGLKSGDYFGEIALLYNRPRAATVKVESPSATVLAIDRKTFQRLMGPLGAILKRNPLHSEYVN